MQETSNDRSDRRYSNGTNTPLTTNNAEKKHTKPTRLFKILVVLCIVAGFSLLETYYLFLVPLRQQNDDHSSIGTSFSEQANEGKEGGFGIIKRTSGKSDAYSLNLANHAETPISYYPDLQCAMHGGPNNTDITKDIVYWKEIPTDVEYISPFKELDQPRYLTFEPDGAGWNNKRMALENAILFAIATGRILVLPPEQMFPFMQNKDQKHTFSFSDFFQLDMIHTKHAGIKIITMNEFLEEVALKGHLRYNKTGDVTYPPGNQTAWNGKFWQPLKRYLRNVSHILDWKPMKCLGVFPATKGEEGVQRLQNIFSKVLKQKQYPKPIHFFDKPTPVNASSLKRMREAMGKRKDICIYDTKIQNEFLIHIKYELIPGQYKESFRLLAHFYSFLFFENWKVDVWSKRFVRDHVRYRDEIMCAASRIVHFLKKHAKSQNPISNPNGDFYTIHVRRNDFQSQYKATEANGTQILRACLLHIPDGSTVYIATDEKDAHFFDPFYEVYDLHFLKDFARFLVNFNTNLFGMVDQMVATQGVKFVGLFYSTFTGYIHRLRGYYSIRDRWPGYEKGELRNDTHYLPSFATNEMWKYNAVKEPFWMREFPVAWRDIDQGTGTDFNHP